MEHGLLRRNRPHPATGVVPFTSDKDPRRAWMADQLDPRIHFALVCGAKSCPRIRVYHGATLDADLDAAARTFCTALRPPFSALRV